MRAALAALLASVLLATAAAAPAHAQAPQAIPSARFYGAVTVPSGQPVTNLTITGAVGTTTCTATQSGIAGSATVNSGQYLLDIQAVPGCTAPGSNVNFTVAGFKAQETGTLPDLPGTPVHLDLHFQAPPPPPPPPPPSTPSAATPLPPPPPAPGPASPVATPRTATPPPPPASQPKSVQGPAVAQAPAKGPVVSQAPASKPQAAPPSKPVVQAPPRPAAPPAPRPAAPALPNTGTGGLLPSTGTGSTWAAVLALASALAAAGVLRTRRR